MKFFKSFFSFGLPFLVAYLGSLYTMSAIPSWYATIEKSPLNPPNWVFGPVWTVLYFLMGLSMYLVWRKVSGREVLPIFIVQLLFNLLWSIVFFGFRNPGLALVVIIVLIALVSLNIYIFHKNDRLAAYLLIPYILWISFASYLNYSVYLLNR